MGVRFLSHKPVFISKACLFYKIFNNCNSFKIDFTQYRFHCLSLQLYHRVFQITASTIAFLTTFFLTTAIIVVFIIVAIITFFLTASSKMQFFVKLKKVEKHNNKHFNKIIVNIELCVTWESPKNRNALCHKKITELTSGISIFMRCWCQ